MININNIIGDLKSKLNGGLPFMDGREKTDIEMNETYMITDFGYLNGEDGEFICFLNKDNNKDFFFGGSVLTTKMKELEEMLDKETLSELLKQGVEVKFTKKKSKNKREYVACEFFASHTK